MKRITVIALSAAAGAAATAVVMWRSPPAPSAPEVVRTVQVAPTDDELLAYWFGRGSPAELRARACGRRRPAQK